MLDPLGVHLTILIGPTVAGPAPLALLEAFEQAEVTHDDEGPSGFQLTFRVGRGGPFALPDFPLLANPLTQPFNRLILVVTVNATPRVLIDGIVTNQHLAGGGEPGSGRLTLTGEDLSYVMGRVERTFQHPAAADYDVAQRIVAQYLTYGITPETPVRPPADPPKSPLDGPHSQTTSDLEHLRETARRHGFVFYIRPGEIPHRSVAYWGPPSVPGPVQRALSVNLGSATNVDAVSFQYDALAPELVSGLVQDRQSNQQLPFQAVASLRVPKSARPATVVHRSMLRETKLRAGGLTQTEAQARAQAMVDAASDRAVTVTGELDSARYGDILWPRRPVGLRGAGLSYDGLYDVKRVAHTIARGAHRQAFTLTRDGLGTTVMQVRT